MASMATSTSFAPPVPTSYSTLALSAMRLLTMIATYENPLLWSFWLGKRNKQADMEGPFYVIGAPSRQLEEGKGIIVSQEMLKKYVPFLMTVRILAADGKPVQNATLDWWQADTAGHYHFADYTLRGRVTTGADGVAEVLTVPPGFYGPTGSRRAGHFHLWIHAPGAEKGGAQLDDLTTQLYVCEANDSEQLKSDFVNYMRKAREGNMVRAWSIPAASGGAPYMDFPPLSADDATTQKRVDWWNAKLAEAATQVGEMQIAAGATADIRLNPKKGWF